MKRILLLAAVFALAAAVLIVGESRFSSTVSAQGGVSDPSDAALAARISRLTDRSTEKLVEHRSRADNTVSLDLGEGFQNVMLARTGSDGEPVAACVTSLGEANEFFGRDLETGAPIASKWLAKSDTASLAARHGMSAQEFEFYLKMIRDAAAQRALSPESATLNIVNGDGPGEGFNDPTAAVPEGGNTGTTRGEQRLQLFQFAASIWGAFLDTSVQIDINSQFNSLSPCTPAGGVLGSAGPTQIYRDFPNGDPNTWYHVALANKRDGSDLNGATPEINARFNTDVDNGCLSPGSRFYYGLNNSTPSLRINLLIVLLHEMGHGLGFSGFVNGSTGALNGGFSDVYTRNMYDRTTGKYWPQMTDAERQASTLNTGNVLWDGSNVKAASSFLTAGRDPAGRVQLYTPSTFSGGSSISHFDTADSPNLLMEPNISIGLPLTLDLTRQEMRDIGWYRDTNADAVPDTITGVAPSGGTLAPGSGATITWTNTGGFNRNVAIELSIDGGATYPTVLAADTANTGSFAFTVPNTPTGQGRIRVREAGFIDPVGVSAANFTIGTATGTNRTRFDYDGDGKADISVFRPSEGNWYIQNSATGGVTGQHHGQSGDVTVPADFDGDGKTDLAIFRPSEGNWYWLNSADNSFTGFHFGTDADKPVAADFDGDNKADTAVYRGSESMWYIQNSTTGFVAQRFGVSEDKPAVGDFDGDGKADVSLFRPSEGNWYYINSSTGQVTSLHFGVAEDHPTPADFDGDGKTDISVFRPSTGEWFRLNSNGGSFFGMKFGTNGDKPAAADFDGDGKADVGVYRPSEGNWYMIGSTTGFFAQRFGLAGDTPTPNSFVY